ncbi:hypothetical protein M9Y57_29530, partial [Pseudomonas putida]|nr:hypothetical protein [Pseudomonas putida]
ITIEENSVDYPKSVPSVGLVGGKFVDEDPGAGTPGSLIPSAWGNAVTEEVLNAIQAAGFQPDENDHSQLAAVFKWFAGGTVTALSATTALTKAQCGLVLANAATGAIALTLPAANAALGVVEIVLRRVDGTSNALTIAASGADKIMLDTIAAAAGLASTELLFSGDYLRLRSDGAGKWWCVGQAQLPGSIDSGLVVFSAAGVSTYTVPAVLRSGRRVAKVTVIGAGGGGGRSGTAGVGSGGGGGVAKARCNLAGVTSVSVTVGAKGLGATVNNGQGTTGGTSSFGGFASATGGVGGAGNSTNQNAGGNTGVGVGGDILSGLGTGSNSFGSDGGIGGGPGFRAQQSAIPGIPASMAGGGGSGAQSAQSGGNGADGEVTLEW